MLFDVGGRYRERKGLEHLGREVVVVLLDGSQVLGAVLVQRGLDRSVAQDLGQALDGLAGVLPKPGEGVPQKMRVDILRRCVKSMATLPL